MCDKSHDNDQHNQFTRQGQIVQVHLTRKECLTKMQHGTTQWKVVATVACRTWAASLRTKQEDRKNYQHHTKIVQLFTYLSFSRILPGVR